MEGRVKTRQPGKIPNSLGRQIGVLPISDAAKPRRKHGAKSIPVGGTDADPPTDIMMARPPSGSSSIASTQSYQTSSRKPTAPTDRRQRVDKTDIPVSKHSNSSSSQGQPCDTGYSDLATETKLPLSKSVSSRTVSGSARQSNMGHKSKYGDGRGASSSKPGSSRMPAPESAASSARSSAAPALDKSSRSSRGSTGLTRSNSGRKLPGSRDPTPRSSRGRAEEAANDADTEEQDIRFTDVPSSQRSMSGSKVRRASGSMPGSAGRKQEPGNKPYKTIDEEEILAQSMESDFCRIYEITLHACEITAIDNMEKFRKVRVLDLSCNFIEQINHLEFNKDLRELKLYDNRLRKIEGLDNLKELTSLQLQHNKIKSIGKGLGALKKMKTLRIDCNQLLKIETFELSQCVQLTNLDISYNMLDSLAALNYLPNLEEVNASGNRLRSVSDLSKCKRLQEIDLSGNRLTDMSGLRGLPKLMVLNISNNHLSSFKSMGRLKILQDLLASNNRIHELSTLATQLPVLETLDLINNEITDWDEFYYLEEMGSLVELFISGNPFCALDGPMPHYYSAIQAVLPELEIIDGAHIKKHVAKGAPLMRPMSASTIVSLRQMDTQMRSADEQMYSLEKSLEEKFASLRSTCDSLPSEPPSFFDFLKDGDRSASSTSAASSRCSRRSRILEARQFAATNLD